MKKIFIILSVLSLFVGCASKPSSKEEDTEKNAMTHEEYMDLLYEKEIDNYIETLYGPMDVLDIPNLYRTYNFNYNSYVPTPDRRMIEPLVTDRKDYSGKITNATNKDVSFRFIAKNQSTQKKVIGEFVIPANETYYVIIENAVLFGENSVVMIDLNPESYANCLALSTDGEYMPPLKNAFFDINNFSIINELFKSHSFEFIYDHICTKEDIENYGRNYATKLVEPFEDKIRNEKNLIIIKQ